MSSTRTEERLEKLRQEAWSRGTVSQPGVDVVGGPIPPKKPGYYGEPVVRPPVWTWEISFYFFIGGLAGMSAPIAAASIFFRHSDVARAAMYLCAAGVLLSPILLILDLGRPRLFINMLRVFKPQSAMSMGVWILTFFGICVVPGLAALELHRLQFFAGAADQILKLTAGLFIWASAVLGVLLATYTGVLIGATVVPAWFLHHKLLPIHFGSAGLGSAAAALELLGYHVPALNAIGLCAAAIETVLMIALMFNRHGAADRAVHQSTAGWLIRISGSMTGPLALILRVIGFLPQAGILFLLGALISRYGWMRAGKVSGADPEAVFASQR